jgi:hypothetical protein
MKKKQKQRAPHLNRQTFADEDAFGSKLASAASDDGFFRLPRTGGSDTDSSCSCGQCHQKQGTSAYGPGKTSANQKPNKEKETKPEKAHSQNKNIFTKYDACAQTHTLTHCRTHHGTNG